jgi:small nuclear ribonucleoprotein (snRNP)-like protein
LEEAVERIYLEKEGVYGEKRVGLYLIRGENVVLLGELVSRSCSSTSTY